MKSDMKIEIIDASLNLLQQMLWSKTLRQWATCAVEYADLAIENKNERNFLMRQVMEQRMMTAYAQSLDLGEEEKAKGYKVLTGGQAVDYFVNKHYPIDTAPLRSANRLKALAQDILDTYSETEAPVISEPVLHRCLEYVSERFDFFYAFNAANQRQCVRPPVCFSIHELAHVCHNSQFSYARSHQHEEYSINLTAVVHDSNSTPEYVLFHELGHLLHALTCGIDDEGMIEIPLPVVDALESAGFPTFGELDEESQAEIIADVLAMGMMLDSEYESKDPFVDIDRAHKQVYQELVFLLCDDAKEQEEGEM